MVLPGKIKCLRLLVGLLGACSLFCISCTAQETPGEKKFTHQDSLRGSINPERAWWDVLHYAIQVEPDFIRQSIKGSNLITFKVLNEGKQMQIDLQKPMNLLSATWNDQPVEYTREGNVYHLRFPQTLAEGSTQQLQLQFSGKPHAAVRPPWDGGWIWKRDARGYPWMTVACQGLGASVWYPCKDHQSDEPDNGASLSITVPDNLVAVANGRLTDRKPNGKRTTTYTWTVVNPINNYNIVPYIGKYVHWGETYNGEKGKLDCDYWVLDYNLEESKQQFKQVATMLKCFEYWFGPYPFYEDGYKLVEAPHLGMEHQSAIAYGNGYQDGYQGSDWSGTGWGKKWDYIIVHESGHEWFGNSITTNDIADMWVHEAFTSYSETLFTTCQFGVEAGNTYCIGTRAQIANQKPVIGHYGVNEEGSRDMYFKGSNLLHTIRQIIDDDDAFRQILRGLNRDFYHKTVDSKQVEDYISQKSGKDLSKIFDQYLRTTQVPVLEYKTRPGAIDFRWTNCVQGFNMPVKVNVGKEIWITPTTAWTNLALADWHTGNEFTVDRNFYVKSKKVN